MQPPLLTPLEPPETLASCLNMWRSWWAVVGHYLFSAPHRPTIEEHFVAACSGLAEEAHDNSYPEGYREQRILWDALSPEVYERCTPQHFFGWEFDFKDRMLYLRGKTQYSLFFRADDVLEENGRQNWNIQPEVPFPDVMGYIRALLEPPYGLQTSTSGHLRPVEKQAPDLRAAFAQLCDELFGNLDTLEIFSWPTDCSAYFDAGHEWWGTGFWTVYSPDKKWIVTILASSTD